MEGSVRVLDTGTPGPQPKGPPRRGLVVVVLGLFVAVVGVMVWQPWREPDIVVPDFSEDVLAVTAAYEATLNAGDVDAFVELFTFDPVIDTASPISGIGFSGLREFLRAELAWKAEMGGQWQLADCRAVGDNAAVCSLHYEDDLLAVGDFVLDGSVMFLTDAGFITAYVETFGLSLSRTWDWNEDFRDWVEANRPTEAALMWSGEAGAEIGGVQIPAGQPLYTPESASLHVQLADLWVNG